jgi:hypothetical protein
MKRILVSSLILALVSLASAPALAYIRFGIDVGGHSTDVKWKTTPVRYFVNSGSVPGVSVNDFQAAVGRAFATWQAVPTASISYQFAGITSALPTDEDGQTTLGFATKPELNRVLASTHILFDESTGEILEADIFFNSTFQWSVASPGESDRFDLESIALHEIGHLSGLGHSALGETEVRPDGGRRVIAAEAVMFPIAYPAGNISGRTLRADDIAAISSQYPDTGFGDTGTISGRVTRDGRGEFGAHLVAFDPQRGSLVGGFSLDSEGRFLIAGLLPGPHIVRLEPLDDADVDSFFDSKTPIDLDFRVSFFDRLVVVPKGGDSGSIEMKAVAK